MGSSPLLCCGKPMLPRHPKRSNRYTGEQWQSGGNGTVYLKFYTYENYSTKRKKQNKDTQIKRKMRDSIVSRLWMKIDTKNYFSSGFELSGFISCLIEAHGFGEINSIIVEGAIFGPCSIHRSGNVLWQLFHGRELGSREVSIGSTLHISLSDLFPLCRHWLPRESANLPESKTKWGLDVKIWMGRGLRLRFTQKQVES